jgi:hypothetical protein
MNVMENLTTNHAARQSQPTSEIADALRTARAVHFRLEDEYHPFEWEERLENAALMRELAESEGVPAGVRELAAAAELRLESEAFDFTDWRDRFETIGFVRDVIARLSEPTQPDVFLSNYPGALAQFVSEEGGAF